MTVPRGAATGGSRRVPEVWGKIPPRNKNFTGREDLLTRLRAGIAGQVTAVVPHALHGLGGVGKTQMAVEYAYRFRAEYDLVWWIPADQPVLVRSSLAGLAPHLGLPTVAASGVEDAANAVLDALRRGEPYSNWLLIFDNADEPEDLREILPQEGPGHVLITSRNHRWDGVVDTVAVDVFSREESIDFLTKRVPRGISVEEADLLAHELGDLPLALEQAGALQAETGMAVSQYLELLAKRTSQLLSQGKPSEYPVSMTAAWGLSVTSLSEKLPEALDVLRCCAFFGPEPIPRDAFNPLVPKVGGRLSELMADPIRLSRVIGELGRYALARLDIQGRTLQVHRLIQALVREEISPAEQGRLRHEVHLILAAYDPGRPNNPANWPRYAGLLGHIGPANVAECDAPEVRDLALNVVRYLYGSGDYRSARTFTEEFLAAWTRKLGEDDEDVLTLQLELGNTLRELGDYKSAALVDTRAFEIAERTLGDDHDVTLRLLRGTGTDQRASGDFPKARATDEEALRRYERKLGKEDRNVLRAINSVALDHGLSSEYLTAREHHQRAHIGWQRFRGEDPTGFLNAWTGLARAVRLSGDYSEACDLGEDAYAFGQQELSADHPWTLRTAKDLSIAWRRAGEYERALELAEVIHPRYVRIFGVDHAETLAAATCLANIYRTVGSLQEAFDLAADTVRRYPNVYGAEHPYTHACAGNLAILHRIMGDPQTARKTNEAALEGLELKLGRDHHYSLTVAVNLASDLVELGETEAATRLGRGTARRLRALLGADHPVALAAVANLVADLRSLGQEDEAGTLAAETEDAYARVLGLEHPDARVFLEGRHLDVDFDPPPI